MCTMSSAEAVDIDLYAEDTDYNFGLNHEEDVDPTAEEDQLLFNSGGNTSTVSKSCLKAVVGDLNIIENQPMSNVSHSSSSPHEDNKCSPPEQKFELLVGNLNWWTSDKVIEDTMRALGVTDIKEIKFFENKVNGQSKGFCVVRFVSEASHDIARDKMLNMKLHERYPVVLPYTKQGINFFESQQQTTRQVPQGGNAAGFHSGHQMMMMGARGHGMGPSPQHHHGNPRGHMMMGPNPPPPMRGGGYNGPRGMPPRNMHPKFNGSPQQQMRSKSVRFPPPPRGFPFQHGMPPPSVMMMSICRPMMLRPHGPIMDGSGMPPPEWNWHAPPIGNYPPPGVDPTSSPPQPRPPMAFFNQQPSICSPPGDNSARVVGKGQIQNCSPPRRLAPPPLTEDEFENALSRNMAVSSSAISRAVADAASGDFGSAIETLVTAISLIKKSKVHMDSRCHVLVTSLHDTLEGIERRSYYGSSSGRSRSRSRDREHRVRVQRRDSDSRGDHGYHRSRSKERDYGDLSKISRRYHGYHRDETVRERDRDRDRRERDNHRTDWDRDDTSEIIRATRH